jgi:hypothetical protein
VQETGKTMWKIFLTWRWSLAQAQVEVHAWVLICFQVWFLIPLARSWAQDHLFSPCHLEG